MAEWIGKINTLRRPGTGDRSLIQAAICYVITYPPLYQDLNNRPLTREPYVLGKILYRDEMEFIQRIK